MRVAQVDRGICTLILSDQWLQKVGKGLMSISLNVEPPTPEPAALDALRAELESRGVAVKHGSERTPSTKAFENQIPTLKSQKARF